MFVCNVNKLIAVYVSPLQVALSSIDCGLRSGTCGLCGPSPNTCLQLQRVSEQVVMNQCLCTLKKCVCERDLWTACPCLWNGSY